MRRLILVVMAVFVLSGCDSGNRNRAKSVYDRELKPGKPAVDFLYPDMEGNQFRLSEKKGSVVILYFWRMKCPECKDGMPSLDALNRRFKDRGLIVVAVGADTMHSAPIGDVREFLEKNRLGFVDIRDDEGFVSEAYQVLRTPHAFIIDKNGMIADVIEGKHDWMGEKTVNGIERLLK